MYHQPSIPPVIASYHHHHPMSNHGVHGNLLEVIVAGCNKLKDTEWISRQDPYVCVEYGSYRNRTRVCRDGGKNPRFQEKFSYSLIEGLRELNITVWNSNTLSHDAFIGSGKVPLAKVLSQGFDDSSWPLQTNSGRHAGEVQLIMHYSNANKPANDYASSAPPYVTAGVPQVSMYSAPPPPSSMFYPPAATGVYPMPSPYFSYLPNSGGYPPPPYPPQVPPYPAQPYGAQYPHGSPYPVGYPPSYLGSVPADNDQKAKFVMPAYGV